MQLEQLKNSYRTLYHASLAINKEMYFDPYMIDKASHDAKYIFITHSHYDHLSLSDINKIVNDKTIFIATKDSIEILKANYKNKIIEVTTNKEYVLDDLKFKTIPSYNKNKPFHPSSNNWVGYLIEINHVRYYIVGDSDYNEYMNKIKCDVLFVPIGGTYTMDYYDASKLTNTIKPLIVSPIHYNSIPGLEVNKEDFIKLVDKNIIVN